MTSYFDAKAQELRQLRADNMTPGHDEVRAWLGRMVADITIVCEFDRGGPMEFPARLRDEAYKLILRTSGEHWPVGVPGYGVDFEHDWQGIELYCRLVEGLHDIFHDAARAGWAGNDNPTSSIWAMGARMEDRCAELIAADPALTIGTYAPLVDEPSSGGEG